MIDPDLFREARFRLGIGSQMAQNISLGGMMTALPIFPRATSGWALALPLVVAGAGLGLLLVPLLAAVLGLVNEVRMLRRPDPVASHHVGMAPA